MNHVTSCVCQYSQNILRCKNLTCIAAIFWRKKSYMLLKYSQKYLTCTAAIFSKKNLTCCCSCSSLSLCCPRSALSERLTSHFHLMLEVWVTCIIPCCSPCHQQVLYLSWKIPDCEPRHGRACLQDLLDLGSLLSPERHMQHAKIWGAYTHILCPKETVAK